MKAKYAVVTGASSGIGKEFARGLSAMGYCLVLVARRRERLEILADELRKNGTQSIIITADLSKREDCDRLMKKLADKEIRVFINSAGFGQCGAFLDTAVEVEWDMIDVNIKAMHFLTKRVLQKMEEQGRGHLLNVASSAGLLPAGPYMATYYASKSYVASFTRAVAQELKEKGSKVYVGVLCPGPVDTEFNEVADVKFSLPGISPKRCVKYALRKMKQRTVVIIPTVTIKAATTLGRILPPSFTIPFAGMQQKKKRDEQ